MVSILLRSSLTALAAVALSGCWFTTSSDREPPISLPRYCSDGRISLPAESHIHGAMRLFERNMYGRARDSGRPFPAYNDWAGEVSAAIAAGRVSAAPATREAVQVEMKDFIPRYDGRDTLTRKAIAEQSDFSFLAQALTERFSCEPQAIREAGANLLPTIFPLPK